MPFDLVHQLVDGVECLTGQERFDLFTRVAVAKQGGEMTIIAGKTRDVETKGPHARALGKYPAHRASSIGGALDQQDPDQIHDENIAVGDVASDLDNEPGGSGRQQRFANQKKQADIERPAQ